MKRTKQSTFAKRERKEKATGFAPVASEEMGTNKPAGSAQFTPGPWVVNTFIVNGQHKLEVLDTTGANACVQANAHLIAAAPAMYEALKAAYRLLREWTPCGEDNQGEVEGLIETALAQAEGRQA